MQSVYKHRTSKSCWRNDGTSRDNLHADPEMIPNPEMIPKSTPKWSRPWNDPHFSSCRPRNDPQGIKEWWLNMGLWIDFFVPCWNAAILSFLFILTKFHIKETICRVTVSFQSRSSLVPVDIWPISLVWCNVSNCVDFSSSSVLCGNLWRWEWNYAILCRRLLSLWRLL